MSASLSQSHSSHQTTRVVLRPRPIWSTTTLAHTLLRCLSQGQWGDARGSPLSSSQYERDGRPKLWEFFSFKGLRPWVACFYDQGNRHPASSAEFLHRAQTEMHRQAGAWRQLNVKKPRQRHSKGVYLTVKYVVHMVAWNYLCYSQGTSPM